MVINRKVLPWLIAGVALAAILLIVLVMVTQAAPNSAPHRQGASISPSVVSYQGQVNIGGVPFSGTGYFRFAIVDTGGTFYWSNDSSTVTPTEAVTLTVVSGLFNVLLGETNPITYGMFSDSDRWLRVWFDDGTHGVQLLEPDTLFTTAPFAFHADESMTATYATTAQNALTFNTSKPSIVGDPYNGHARGLGAVDLQLKRDTFEQTAYMPYSTICGGASNTASGSYSTVGGGWNNTALGYGSTVIGGRLNSANGNYCVATGFRANSGGETNHGVFIFGDSTDEDFGSTTGNEFAIRARGGFRHAYDNSNYWTAQVDSVGGVVLNSVGITPSFTINDSLTVNGPFSATVLTATNATTATYATTALTATNATTATYATTALTATNSTTALTATNVLSSAYSNNIAIGARVYSSVVLTVPNVTWYNIPFNSEQFDTNSIHSGTELTLTCKTGGIYILSGNVRYNNAVTGTRILNIVINGSTSIVYDRVAALVGGIPTYLNISTIYSLNTNDTITLQTYQDSGYALQIIGSGTLNSADLTVVRIP